MAEIVQKKVDYVKNDATKKIIRCDQNDKWSDQVNPVFNFADTRQKVNFEGDNDFSYQAHEWLILL